MTWKWAHFSFQLATPCEVLSTALCSPWPHWNLIVRRVVLKNGRIWRLDINESQF